MLAILALLATLAARVHAAPRDDEPGRDFDAEPDGGWSESGDWAADEAGSRGRRPMVWSACAETVTLRSAPILVLRSVPQTERGSMRAGPQPATLRSAQSAAASTLPSAQSAPASALPSRPEEWSMVACGDGPALPAPTVAAVVAAAHRAAGLAHDPLPSMRRRSRVAALVPWITTRAGNSESWRDVDDPTISHSLGFDIRLAWRLDRLVFDPNELRFSALETSRRRDRRRLASVTSRAYFAWLDAHVAAARDEAWLLRAEEAAAELDALTDGWFSEAIAKPAQSR